MYEIELSTKRLLSVWWLVFWRVAVGGAALGAAAGVLVGVTMGMAGRHDLVAPAARLAGMVVSVPWSIMVLSMALRKKYAGFRVALVSLERSTGAYAPQDHGAAATFGRRRA